MLAWHRRFQCNVCGMFTDVPMDYFCALDANGQRHDIANHPELTQGSVEYLAPQEYMVCTVENAHIDLCITTNSSDVLVNGSEVFLRSHVKQGVAFPRLLCILE